MPTIKNVYDIEMSTEEMRDALTARFRSNAEVSDPRIVDMLVSKGTMELEETLLQFKTKPHVMKVLEDHSAVSQLTSGQRLVQKGSQQYSPFLKDFLNGNVA